MNKMKNRKLKQGKKIYSLVEVLENHEIIENHQ
jgi:hypothetical protein